VLEPICFSLLPNMRGIYQYLHRAPLTLRSPKQCALYLASNHTYLPSYPIINNEHTLTRIRVMLFLYVFHFLKICCRSSCITLCTNHTLTQFTISPQYSLPPSGHYIPLPPVSQSIFQHTQKISQNYLDRNLPTCIFYTRYTCIHF